MKRSANTSDATLNSPTSWGSATTVATGALRWAASMFSTLTTINQAHTQSQTIEVAPSLAISVNDTYPTHIEFPLPQELINHMMGFLNPVIQRAYLREVSKSFYHAWENVAKDNTLRNRPSLSGLITDEDFQALRQNQQQEIVYLKKNRPAILRMNANRLSIVEAFEQLDAIESLSQMITYQAKEKCLNKINEGIIRQKIELVIQSSETQIDLSNHYLTRFPHSIFTDKALESFWKNQTKLNLSNNRLSSLPESINQCIMLEELRIYNNLLSALPESLAQLARLKWLQANDNQLTLLPERISELKALSWIEVTNNKLTTLPANIGQCTALKMLNASNNRLTSIPDNFVECQFLMGILLSDNYLCSLPKNLPEALLFKGIGTNITKSELLSSQRKLPFEEVSAYNDRPALSGKKLG